MDPTETCALCKKSLNDPKTLPCLHSLCTHCIEDLLKKESDAKMSKVVVQKKVGKKNTTSPTPLTLAATAAAIVLDDALCCPQCSARFVVPAGVAALTADTYVLGLAKQKETASKINPNDVQCSCEDEPALVHCNMCDAFFGDRCAKSHLKSKANASHVVVKVAEYFKGSGPTTRILFCQHHPGSEIDTFCKTDDQPMCSKCVVPNHNSHHLVKLKDVSLDFSEITKALQPV